MGKLTETLTPAPRVRALISLNIDSIVLTASAVMREGVIVNGVLIPTTGDTPIAVPAEAAAAQLTQPIGTVAAGIGLTSEQLLAMSFGELMVAMFDPHTS